MLRRLPIFPTIVVLIAVGIMIRLGFWQIDRLHQKEALVEEYTEAISSTRVSDLGNDLMIDGPFEYSHVTLECVRVTGLEMRAGRNARGVVGWADIAHCQFPFKLRGTSEAEVVIGWSLQPSQVEWKGGKVAGTVVPSKGSYIRIVADPPLAGLEANAVPDPRDIPNNHLSYAVQWFLFAGVALVIYALAVRKRLRGE